MSCDEHALTPLKAQTHHNVINFVFPIYNLNITGRINAHQKWENLSRTCDMNPIKVCLSCHDDLSQTTFNKQRLQCIVVMSCRTRLTNSLWWYVREERLKRFRYKFVKIPKKSWEIPPRVGYIRFPRIHAK